MNLNCTCIQIFISVKFSFQFYNSINHIITYQTIYRNIIFVTHKRMPFDIVIHKSIIYHPSLTWKKSFWMIRLHERNSTCNPSINYQCSDFTNVRSLMSLLFFDLFRRKQASVKSHRPAFWKQLQSHLSERKPEYVPLLAAWGCLFLQFLFQGSKIKFISIVIYFWGIWFLEQHNQKPRVSLFIFLRGKQASVVVSSLPDRCSKVGYEQDISLA